ncbi:MAG: HD-GYP domain-containing protein [Deltaproteobacteria bacterium]|nr:HD-GYP domain-containing protein [Deltaproteobacteria bacterium]
MALKNIRAQIKRDYATIVMILLFVAIAGFIIQLVAQVTRFSKGVTDFYAPTIHDVKSFAEAINHLEMGIEKNGVSEEMSVVQLQETTKRLKALSGSWEPGYRKHIEGLLAAGERLASELQKRKISGRGLLSEARHLNEEAQMHVRMHDAELEEARTGIQSSALKIRIVVLVLLVIGIIISFREVQVQRLREQEKEKMSAITALATALEARDPYTKGHSLRVAEYTRIIGGEMGLSKKELEHLNLASLMHDVGKIAVPDSILRKEDTLTDQEWEQIKEHARASAQILNGFESLKEMAQWTLDHHERFDGKGYPNGKSGMDIPLPAQIMAIADSFDAMTTSRPYRPGMALEAALSEIEKNKGKQWRLDVVEAFMRCHQKDRIKILKLG